MNRSSGESGFWKEIYTYLEDCLKGEDQGGKTSKNEVGLWTLAVKPVFIFLKSFIIDGNFLKGRVGYNESVHHTVLQFAGDASKYEKYAVEKNGTSPIDGIE